MTEPNPFAEHLIRYYGNLSFERADTGVWVPWWGPIEEIVSRAGRAKSETLQEYQARQEEAWQRAQPPDEAIDIFDYAASRALALLSMTDYSGEAFTAWLDHMRECKWKGLRGIEHSLLDRAFGQSAEFYKYELLAKSRSVAGMSEGSSAESTSAATGGMRGRMEQLGHEFERYANASQELGARVFIQGERYDGWRITDVLGNAPESDSVRIFKSLARRAARAAGLTGGQAGPEDWRLWLRHLCEVDSNFRITGQATGHISERQFNALKESGEPTEGYVRQTVEFTEADLIEHARLIYSKPLHGVDFDLFVQLLRATPDLPQKGDEPRMPRVGESITRYICESQCGELLRIFNASAIRCMELSTLASKAKTMADPEAAYGTKQSAATAPPPIAGTEVTTPTNAQAAFDEPRTAKDLPVWALNLRAAREEKQLSRSEAAKVLGFSAEAIKKHEEGNAFPRPENQEAYAGAYGRRVDELFPK